MQRTSSENAQCRPPAESLCACATKIMAQVRRSSCGFILVRHFLNYMSYHANLVVRSTFYISTLFNRFSLPKEKYTYFWYLAIHLCTHLYKNCIRNNWIRKVSIFESERCGLHSSLLNRTNKPRDRR